MFLCAACVIVAPLHLALLAAGSVCAGGGAGGSVAIAASTFQGTGSILARGGSGGTLTTCNGGAGAGGRIASKLGYRLRLNRAELKVVAWCIRCSVVRAVLSSSFSFMSGVGIALTPLQSSRPRPRSLEQRRRVAPRACPTSLLVERAQCT
jgi:hypothetical protein